MEIVISLRGGVEHLAVWGEVRFTRRGCRVHSFQMFEAAMVENEHLEIEDSVC